MEIETQSQYIYLGLDFERTKMDDMIPLVHMATGAKARIGQLVGHPDQVHRLEELGLRNGTVIEMLQNGSPCIIRFAESKLCFRPNEEVGVLVYVDKAS